MQILWVSYKDLLQIYAKIEKKFFVLIFRYYMPSCLSYRRLHWGKKEKTGG